MKKHGSWKGRLVALACVAAVASVANATYIITDLGDGSWFYNGGGAGLRSNSLQYRLALNNNNEVVGTGLTTAYYWANDSHQKLTGFASGQAKIFANDINDSGVIVGQCVWGGTSSDCGSGAYTSYALTRNTPAGAWTPLGNLGGTGFIGNTDAAFGVNANGVTVGVSTDVFNSAAPTAFSNPASYVGPYGGSGGRAWAINDNNSIVTSDAFGRYAIRFDGLNAIGTGTQLVGLGNDTAIAADINNQNIAVGSSRILGETIFHATMWNTRGQPTDLGALAGNYYSYASAINESGVAVGQSGSFSNSNDDENFAVLFEGGRVINLNSFAEIAAAGWSLLYSATDINEAGSIVGFGLKDGAVHAYLLTLAPVVDPDPNNVPLPAPLAMLAFGLLALPRALHKT